MAELDYTDDSGESDTDVVNPALLNYGKSLGADLERHPDMLWLVRQAFSSPLPAAWSEHEDASGRIYFFNSVTQESSWTHPRDEVFREIIQLIKAIRKEGLPVERRVARIQEHLEVVQRRATESLINWSGPYPSELGQYYHHGPSGASIWENPVDDWQNELALRHRALCWFLLPEEWRSDAAPAMAGVSEMPPSPSSPAAGKAGPGAAPPSPTDAAQGPCMKLSAPAVETAAPPSPPSSARSFVSCRSTRSVRSNRSLTPSSRRGVQKVSFEHARPPVTAQEANGPRPEQHPGAPSSGADGNAPHWAATQEAAAAARQPRGPPTAAANRVPSGGDSGGGGSSTSKKSRGEEDDDPFDFSFGMTASMQRALPKFGT